MLFDLAVKLFRNIGDVRAKQLLEHFGTMENLFTNINKIKSKEHPSFESILKHLKDETVRNNHLNKAKEEVNFIEQHKIEFINYLDQKYPPLLRECIDGPFNLFFKGNADLTNPRTIAIVGARKATSYGKSFTEQLVQALKPYQPLIVSGLAYGIDLAAHEACIKNGIATVAVLGHSLDQIYPAEHRNTAKEILKNGGLLTDYWSKTNPFPENFPKRNRIVAGMSQATIIVEAAIKGGALVTANLTSSYNRELYAVPGKSSDPYSKGCNHLIKTQKAILLDDPEELAMELGWTPYNLEKKFTQNRLLEGINEPLQKSILLQLSEHQELDIEMLCNALDSSPHEILPDLLTLEMIDKIKSVPGNYYRLGVSAV